MKYYKLDENKKPVECDLYEWARFIESKERFIKLTQIGNEKFVSTVFVGTEAENAPKFMYRVFFETAIINKFDTEVSTRSDTFDQSMKDHERLINLSKNRSDKVLI